MGWAESTKWIYVPKGKPDDDSDSRFTSFFYFLDLHYIPYHHRTDLTLDLLTELLF